MSRSVVENMLGGIAAAAVAALVGFGVRWWRSRRITIRRLRIGTGRDVDELLALYSSLFPPDGTNYTENEIAEFLGDDAETSPSRHVAVENMFFIAKIRGEVIGFIWSCYYPSRRSAIIPYYGIDKSVKEARLGVGIRLVRQLFNTLRKCTPACRTVVFEVQKPNLTVDVEERRKRVARIRRFKDVGKQLSILIRELDFTYTRPRLSVADDPLAKEEELVLLMARADETPWGDRLNRKTLTDLLTFLYHDCYGDVYSLDDPRHNDFHEYLRKRLCTVLASLPEQIRLKS